MKSGEKKMLCLDLNPVQRKNVDEIAGKKVDNIIYIGSGKNHLSSPAKSFGEVCKDIFLILIPWRVWKNIPSNNGKKVIFINEIKEELFEELQCISQCVVGITSEGMDETLDVKEIIEQATDLNNFIHTLRKEVELYKNLYLRKDQQLELIKNIFTNIREEESIGSIFKKSFLYIQSILPLQSMAFVIKQDKYYIYISKGDNRFQNVIVSKLKEKDKNVDIITYDISEVSAAKTFQFFHDNIFIVETNSNKNVNIFFYINELKKLGEDKIELLNIIGEYLSIVIERNLKYVKLLDAAYFDFLTGLGNRHLFDKIIKQEKKRHERLKQPFSILILDIDYFKNINDKYGHDVGDYILKEIGKIIKESVRDVDYPIRYGGEEFIVILPHTSKKDAFVIADRLRKIIERHTFKIGNNILHITVSIGISEFNPSLHTDIDHVLKEADMALYKSKKEGRNRVSVYK